MGCCENRDVHFTQTNEKTPIPSTPYSEAPVPRSRGYSSDSSHWDLFTHAREHDSITALVALIHSPEEVEGSVMQDKEWTRPNTVGGCAMVELMLLCNKNPKEVGEAMRNDLHKLVECIESQNSELQDPALQLLHAMCPALGSSLKDRIVNVGGFSCLLRVMRGVSSLKRQTSADTCLELYAHSDSRKNKFVAAGGIPTLVHVMSLDRDAPALVHKAILRFQELLACDSEGDNSTRLVEMVKTQVVEALGTLDLTAVGRRQLDHETIEVVEKISIAIQAVRMPNGRHEHVPEEL